MTEPIFRAKKPKGMDGTFLTGVKVAQVLLFLAVFPSAVCTDLFSEYADHAVLDAEEKMKLFWNIDWDAETVSFAVEAETTGWVGFGFSTGSGQMIGSDVVIGWVKDNKGYLTVTNTRIAQMFKRRTCVFTFLPCGCSDTVLN